jgi:hypothetical protein
MEESDKQNVAAVVSWALTSGKTDLLDSLQQNGCIGEVALLMPSESDESGSDEFGVPQTTQALSSSPHTILEANNIWSDSAVADVVRWFEQTGASHLLWIFSPTVDLPERGLQRLLDAAIDTEAPIVYADYLEQRSEGQATLHPLIDYQPGSLRDDFDFGQVVLIAKTSLTGMDSEVAKESPRFNSGGWYDLRLRLSELGPIVHLCEPAYTVALAEPQTDGESHFRYVDPRNRDYQLKMEQIATAHLKRIGAYLEPPAGSLVAETEAFPVEASVIIPVRNRARTVADAVRSALSQQADFEFNVLVVDNYSEDGTSRILAELAQENSRLVIITPTRSDLGIGGCWNEAIGSDQCGRFALQLDSDDLYSGPDVLSQIVTTFHESGAAMVIGSYTIVDFDLNPIPPGLVDHREWTDANGRNNALRIAGLGAPRAFHVPTLRAIGLPNVSYGEDYAVVLRMTRNQIVGRIYDSLYWCRRWEDNTDYALPLETKNRHAVYKDRLRTIEIAARQRMNHG